jgi:inosine-uridine nucleoside N-ribohydrolase
MSLDRPASALRNRLLPLLLVFILSLSALAQQKTKIILDTDIGDDIDDAYALGLILSSPELDLIGIGTSWGNTEQRTKLVSRMLHETGRDDIPVVSGIHTGNDNITQYGWAESFKPSKSRQQNVVDFYLELIDRYPGQITLVAIGPLTNVGALIDRDPVAFRKLKQVAIMGGNATLKSYDVYDGLDTANPAPEYNIMKDVPAAKKLFAAGVPIIMAGLESTTMLKLDEVKRARLWRKSSPLTDSITILYHLWGSTWGGLTPTLFDPMAVAVVIDPTLARLEPMHIEIDDKGVTRNIAGKPANAQVLLAPQTERFFDLIIARLLKQNLQRAE